MAGAQSALSGCAGPQVVVTPGPYIAIAAVNPGLYYVPIYDPLVVFAPPRRGLFIGGAIPFGAGITIAPRSHRGDGALQDSDRASIACSSPAIRGSALGQPAALTFILMLVCSATHPSAALNTMKSTSTSAAKTAASKRPIRLDCYPVATKVATG